LRFRDISRSLTALIAAAAMLLAAAVTSQAAPPVQLTYANANYTINTAGGSPYIGTAVVPLTATTWGTVNSKGVVQVKINNVVVYHPVNSAWFVNQMLSSYRVTKNPEYLRRADATTRYILSGSFSDASGATWFPYKFRHTPGNKIDMGIPWYSGMAQGMMLSTLVNLYETTGNTYWKTQADRVFRSYQVPKKNGQPWFQDQVLRGSKVYMWFEEYVGTNIPSSHVVNGHIYAAWGAYDYYRLTKNPTAQWMFNTSATTIRDYFTSYRRPGTVSWYAASPYGQYVWRAPASYHKGVTNQLAILGRQTGDPAFATQSALLKADYS
jgi:hypothetical protein